ncbi:MAG: methyltransferase domain-containing protein [Exilibacterium sp.]
MNVSGRKCGDVINELNKVIKKALPPAGANILEAGCGSLSLVEFSKDSHITGVDISQEQLDKNTILNEKILADIQTYQFKPNTYDMIVCWDVLEHLTNPKAALDNMLPALKPNGIIVVAVPNIDSLKGLITKCSPHGFHVFVYKHILGKRDAGQPGCAPFPTVMEKIISPPTLAHYFTSRGYKELKSELYDALPAVIRDKKIYLKFFYYFFAVLLSVVSGNRLGGRDNTDYACIYHKPECRQSSLK